MGHFWVAWSLCFKARLSAKALIWKYFLILMQIKPIFTPKVLHWASLRTGNSLFNWWNESLLPSILCEVAPVPSHNIQPLHFFHFIKGAWKDEIYSYRWEVKKKSLQKHLIINLPSSFSEILMAAYLKKEHIKMSATSTCKKDQKTKRNVINWWCCLLRRIVLTSSFLVEAWTWKCHQCRSQVIGKACSPHFSPKFKKQGHCYNKVL